MRQPEDLLKVARRVVWFEPPEATIEQPKRFLAYLMTYGTWEEVLVAKKYFSDQEFESVLVDPSPGIFDVRSWNYWNLLYNHDPVPPLPQRSFSP